MNYGDIVSHYRIVGALGKGGMGLVYRAEDTRLYRPVALKFLPPDSFSEQDRQRFLNEARAAAAVRHPNVCPIFDIGETDGRMFIAMAYLDGETLFRRIARGPMKVGQAIKIAVQIANGLDCAHQLGIVHRDIKSGNVIVDPSGHASILDFGLALLSGATRVTAQGGVVGTSVYMSPEQTQGHAVDRRTDLWSLGVVLFEMLAGSVPFRRDHPAAVLHAVLFDPVPPLSKLRPDVPPELQRAVERALAKEPDARWQTAREMAAELKRIQAALPPDAGDGPMTSHPTVTLAPQAAPPRKMTRAAMAVALSVLVLIVAGVGAKRFLDGRKASQPAAVSQAPVGAKQVAVLPFTVIGSEKNTGAVADGMVEILTTALSDFERFQGAIAAVPASEVRRRGLTTPEEARRIYGVGQAITGTAEPLGSKIRFTLNLMDTASLKQIDSKIFEYDVRDPMASRDRAVTSLGSLMKFDLTPAAGAAIRAGDTAAPSAYSAYLEGRGLLARYDVAGNIDQAIARLRAATKQDPTYALAYAGLGEAYWRKARATTDKRWAALAVANAERAVQLDGNLAIVHAVLGTVYRDAGRQPEAIRELNRAMELAPGNAEAPRQLAEIYSSLGRFEEAEALYVQATKSRPTDWYGHNQLGLFYYQRERYAEAETALNRAKVVAPDNDLVYRNLGGIYRMHGRYREAIQELQQALRIRSNALTYAALGGAYFAEHRFAEAVAAEEAAIDLDSNDYRYWGNLGIYCKWAPGNSSKAAPALERAIELAQKFLQTAPTDLSARANLAEYRARLGDAKGAQAEIDRIPEHSRKPLTTRLAIAYELTGQRQRAIEIIRVHLKSEASLNQIKDDPDLAQLWKDPQLQKAIRSTPTNR